MSRYMLDTNICIYVTKEMPMHLVERFNASAEQMCISSITYGELRYGVEKSARRLENLRKLEEFAGRLEIFPFTTSAAEHYGQIRADLERAGTPIGNNDLLIGAHARSEGLILVTNNRREFDRIPGLRVENWL
ncbi:type II toxin-antitoxin system tRNA(fMet)-specific endonuclease VapC [Terrarubrum flagellatum]|uniref:type II toxin-antitoxin system tRNA(fMet)-specific endonuclease VapC n=1 Tax=Terrirubrum flagellatum TaxID=2895980 RepID=UPI0031455BD0